MSTNKIILYTCILAILLVLLPGVFAISASIGNSKMVLRVGPGEEVEKYILVKNVNDAAVNISLEVTGELINNVKLEETSFRLEAKEEKRAIFTIKAGENGTSETKVNVKFTPDEGSSVGLSSEIIMIVNEKYAGAGRITEENGKNENIVNKNDSIIDKITGMISSNENESDGNSNKMIIFAVILSFILLCTLIGFYFYSLTKRMDKKEIDRKNEKMNKGNILIWLVVIFTFVILISNVSAETQLLCLNDGETVKFSQCISVFRDKTCSGQSDCSFCVDYNALTKVYCPSNINVCNSIQQLTCSGLNQNNQTNNNETNNGGNEQNHTGKVKADIAYIVKNSIGVDNNLLSEVVKNGYSYEIIYEVNVNKTNFGDYYILMLGNQKLDNVSVIPFYKYKSLIINSYNFYEKNGDKQIGWSTDIGSLSSPTILTVRDATHPIASGLANSFNAYTIADVKIKSYFLSRSKPTGTNLLIYGGVSTSNAVIAAVEKGTTYLNGKIAEDKAVFFGITESAYWTDATKKLFSNSLAWLVNEYDLDGDGYSSDVDCNDRNPEIYPGNSDLGKDCKNDAPNIEIMPNLEFFKSDKVTIKVNATDPEGDELKYVISDSRFNFSEIDKAFYWQPSNSDEGDYIVTIKVSDNEYSVLQEIFLEIKNNPPEFKLIPNIAWKENEAVRINLSDYFYDKNKEKLTFGIASTSDNKEINVEFVSESVMEFKSSKDWSGEDWIIFFADDGSDRINSNKVILTVDIVNDAPKFNGTIADLEWDEDKVKTLNLNEYFTDSDSVLSYNYSGNKNINIAIENGKAKLTPLKDWSGTEKIIFSATDGEFSVSSNKVNLKVIEMGEPPEFENMSCEKEIEEDREYSCLLLATDFEGNSFNFSVGEENKLRCFIEGDVLSYIGEKDYYGEGDCEIIVADIDGENSYLFNVNIVNVDDAPTIKSSLPSGDVAIVPENINKNFHIEGQDVDGDLLNIQWILDGNAVGNGKDYNFNKGQSSYLLQAIISDGESEAGRFWSVIVGRVEDFSCSEISGFICGAEQVCSSGFLNTKDSLRCCSSQCEAKPKEFKEESNCKIVNKTLELIIESPDSNDEFEAGDEISVEVRVKNHYKNEQNVNLKVNLYDTDDDSIISKDSGSEKISSGSESTFNFKLSVPEDINLDDKYIIFAKAEDDLCNQEYIDIEVVRPEKMLEMTEFKIDGVAECGENMKASIRITNLGSTDQDVSISLKNKELKLEEVTNFFEVAASGKSKDSILKIIEFKIAEGIRNGVYNVTAMVNGDNILSESLILDISNCLKETSSEETEVAAPLVLNNESATQNEGDSNWIIILGAMLLTTFTAIMFLFVASRIAKKKRKVN